MKTHKQLMQELKEKDPELYKEIIEESAHEIEEIKKQWGGVRPNAGRKKVYVEKIKETYDLEKADVINLKDYAKKHNLSKNKALSLAINKLVNG